MVPTINVADELYRELGRFGNRDESWNDVLARLIEHADEDAALNDRDDRATTYTGQTMTDTSGLEELPTGTMVRHKFKRGQYSGETVEATVDGGRIKYDGETWSPSGAAREADRDLRGDDARGSGYSGWEFWEYENEDGNWVQIGTLRG